MNSTFSVWENPSRGNSLTFSITDIGFQELKCFFFYMCLQRKLFYCTVVDRSENEKVGALLPGHSEGDSGLNTSGID